MYALFYTIAMVLLWIIDLFNGTGLGMTYKTNEIAMLSMSIITVICLASQSLHDGDLLVKPKYFYTIIGLVLTFFGIATLRGQFENAWHTLWAFLVVYSLSKTKPSHTAIRLTAICYAVMGLIILLLFNFTDFFKGWNANTIGMIGLFSFLIFTIPFFGMREWRSFVAMPLIGTAYVLLIFPTGSRSCTVVIIIQLLLILRILPSRKLLESKKAMIVLMLVPLFVAIFVVMFAAFGDMSGLTEWSYEKFNKPLFNGRDEIWLQGFEIWAKTPIFGPTKYNTGYWHNSAIACLMAGGAVGYVFWVRLLYLIINESKPYLDDICITGSVIAFIVLYCQQSVELGLFALYPSILPYVILGMMLGRIRYIKQESGNVQG